MSEKKSELPLRAQVKPLLRLLYDRFFPYLHFFVVTFPFFALLIINGNISADNGLFVLYLLPCLFTFIALYLYNDLHDAKIDPAGKNPISRGELQKRVTFVCTVFFTLLAIVSAVMIYASLLAIGVLFSLVYFSLAYSGLKTRFKTTVAGPFVASYVLWVAPSLALIVEFSFLNNISVSLLLGIFLVFTSHELHHQIDDFGSDKEKNAKTLTVRFGVTKAFLFSTILSVSGFLFLVYGVSTADSFLCFAVLVLFALYLSFHVLLAITKSSVINLNIPVKLVLTVFGCAVLAFQPVLTLLVLLIFLAEAWRRYVY